MTEALEKAKAKDAIIESRGESKQVVVGTRKYIIHLADGRKIICIDLQNEPPEQVERQVREQFSHYGVTKVES